MSALFNWFLGLLQAFQEIGEWLIEPLTYADGAPVVIGGIEVNMLAFLGVGVLGAVVVFKIVDLVVPV